MPLEFMGAHKAEQSPATPVRTDEIGPVDQPDADRDALDKAVTGDNDGQAPARR